MSSWLLDILLIADSFLSQLASNLLIFLVRKHEDVCNKDHFIFVWRERPCVILRGLIQFSLDSRCGSGPCRSGRDWGVFLSKRRLSDIAQSSCSDKWERRWAHRGVKGAEGSRKVHMINAVQVILKSPLRCRNAGLMLHQNTGVLSGRIGSMPACTWC